MLSKLKHDNRTQPPPRRRVQLFLWWMVYRLPVDDPRNSTDVERAAAIHCKLPPDDLERARQERPQWFANAHRKRQRRLAWQREHGSVPDGWTPPEPGQREFRHPVEALFYRAYEAPLKRQSDCSQWSEGKMQWALQTLDDSTHFPVGHWRRRKAFERVGELAGRCISQARLNKALKRILPQ